jgi:hypothetical protein
MKPRPNRLAELFASASLIACTCSLWGQPETPAALPPASPATAPAEPASKPTPPPAVPAEAKPVAGQDVEIVFRDGRSSEGEFVEQDSKVVVVILGGHRQPIPRTEIAGVRPLAPIAERFEALRSATADDDAEGILQLAEWIRSRGRLDLALAEVERVLAFQRNNRDALELRTVITEQARLDALRKQRTQQSGEPPTKPSQAKPKPETTPKKSKPNTSNARTDGFPLLSADEINILRVFEVDMNDPPRMLIKRDVIDRFLANYAGKNVPGRGSVPSTPEGRQQFLQQTPAQILSWFFDLQAREFYNDVRVREDPRAFKLFRDNVNLTWLHNRCATNRCHGGTQAGRLWLTNNNPASVESAYTNFFILERFRTADGKPLINYTEPANSPLLQMGLQKDRARIQHPAVAGMEHWDTPFKSEQDDRFLRAVEWIRAMYPRRTEYPVAYVPPDPTKIPPPPRAIPPADQPAANPPDGQQLTPPPKGMMPTTPEPTGPKTAPR